MENIIIPENKLNEMVDSVDQFLSRAHNKGLPSIVRAEYRGKVSGMINAMYILGYSEIFSEVQFKWALKEWEN